MKKLQLNIRSIRVYATAVFTSILLLSTTASFAGKAETSETSEQKANIAFVGQTDNQLTFNISYANASNANFWIILNDDSGHVLYQKKFSDQNFSKNIVLKNVGDFVQVNFSVKSDKTSVNQKFNIDTKTKTIDEIVETRIKG